MVKRFFSHILVGFFVAVSYLPFWLLYLIADVFYAILYYIVGYRKSVVRENLKNSFPQKSKEELRAIEKKSYHHLADLFVEIIKLHSIKKEELSKRCTIKNVDFLNRPEYKNKSFVCIQAHYGNWEWSTHMNDLIEQRVLSVYKPLHDEAQDDFIRNVRARFGSLPVPKNHILRVLARRQKRGQLSAVGLVSDQKPKNLKTAHWMSFLNQDTPVFLGVEKMAKMFDLPVAFVYSKKIKRGYYELEFLPVVAKPSETAEFEITERHIRLTEKMIQEAPELWTWTHKRWKHKRDE